MAAAKPTKKLVPEDTIDSRLNSTEVVAKQHLHSFWDNLNTLVTFISPCCIVPACATATHRTSARNAT